MLKPVLLVIDYQNDFVHPAGTLYVKGGETLADYIKQTIETTKANGGTILTTQDWHPVNHCSFLTEKGGIWPKHCMATSWGAEVFEPVKEILTGALATFKGANPEKDSYSGFGGACAADKSLLEHLILLEPSTIEVVGVATEYCVKATVLDALKLLPNYKINVHRNGIAAVNFNTPHEGDEAIQEMQNAGAIFI
jgi:nicotinamidase/pyrazinamidase